jgi:DNA replication protein DnaC
MISKLLKTQHDSCPHCGGTGWELVQGKGVRPCPCKDASRIQQLFSQARIPKFFANKTLHNFETYNNSLTLALIQSKRFVEEFPLVESGLLYVGRPGVGKTHLALAVLRETIAKGFSGLFYDFRDLLKEIQDSYNPNTHTSELRILAPVFQADILVLDELGANKPTEWVQETITHIIAKRYNDRKITIFTSNYLDDPTAGSHEEYEKRLEQERPKGIDLERSVSWLMGSYGYTRQMAEHIVLLTLNDGRGAEPEALRLTIKTLSFDEKLQDRVGERLRSRIYEMCKLISLNGQDYRKVMNKRGWPLGI